MTARADPLDEMLAAWEAEAITLESDRIAGTDRKAEREACAVRAVVAARLLDPHPLDPHISAERDRANRAYKTRCPDQWWTNEDDVLDARVAAAVVRGLLFVRKGGRPVEAARLAAYKCGRELPRHRQEQIEMRVWHLCRLAGLMEVPA